MSAAVPLAAPGSAGTTGSKLVRHAPSVLLRLAMVLLILTVAASPFGNKLLAAALPLQRTVYECLMPDFRVYEFGFVQTASHLKLRVLAVSHHYLSLQGQAFAPGLGLRGETPARMALTYAALVLAGAALLTRGGGLRLAVSALLASVFATLMLCGITPLIIAGQQWATVVAPFSEISAAAFLGGLSDVLLHGGGYGLAALAVVLIRTLAKGSGPPCCQAKPEAQP